MPYLYHMTGGALTLATVNALLPVVLSGGTNMPHTLALLIGAGCGLLLRRADEHASGI